MHPVRLLLLLLAFAYACPAQVMNVRKWRQSERDSLDNALQLIDEQYYLQALPVFEQLLASHPGEQFLQYSFAKCALQRGDKQHEAYDLLTAVYAKTRKLPDIEFDLALAAFYRNKFDEAGSLLAQYLSNKKIKPEEKSKAERLQRYIANARVLVAAPGPSRVSLMGEAVNSEFDEYAPAVRADNSMLAFTYAGPKSTGGLQAEDLGEDLKSRIYQEDIFVSEKKEKRFQAAVALDSLNTFGPDMSVAMTPDGRKLILYQDIGDGHGDMYYSASDGRQFLAPVLLKGPLNGYSRETHAALSPDGKTIYFSSDRAGGFGGLDIYRASLAADSTWTNIRNLGDSVNSAEDEDTPFMSADGTTLFFSSRGRNSMGGFDVFRTTMDPADSTFSGTRNLGVPVNGTSDDLYFVLAADGRSGYMSSARKEGLGMNDIFQVQAELSPAPGPVYLARGQVRADGRPAVSTITVEREGQQRGNYTTLYTDSVTGEFMVILPRGHDFHFTCSAFGMVSSSFVISTRLLREYTEMVHRFDLVPVKSETVVAAPVAQSSVPATSSGSAQAGSAGSPGPVSSTTVAWPDADGFMPLTLLQKKTMRYLKRYGLIAAPDLEFRVQFAAVKGVGNMYFPSLSKFGRIERLRLNDGYTRMTVGGAYKTLGRAWSTNKKAVKAGQTESFVIALYKGKRVQFEDLEKLGIFK